MHYGWISFIVLLCILVGFFIYYEMQKKSAKELAIAAVLAAFASAGRILFVGIPNVQPTTFFVMVTGFVFGPAEGFLVGAVSALASNIVLGQGPWTPWQMFGWGLCGFLSGILRKWLPSVRRSQLVILCILYGYLFGIIMNLWQWLMFVYPLNSRTFLAVWSTSFLFDSMHAIGNGCFAYLLGEDLIRVLQRFKNRFTYIDSQSYTNGGRKI